MRLFVSSVVLGLAWFAATNILASAAAWLIGRRALRKHLDLHANTLLALRLAPAVVSAAFVCLLFVPVHWMLEPAAAKESLGMIFLCAAVAGLALVVRSAVRVVAVGRAGAAIAALARSARNGRDPIEVPGLQGVSLAGVLRTRILVGSEARATLTSEELDVAIAHERAHRRSWDNLKRSAMFCAPDLFGWSAVAGSLEQRWRAEAECLADAWAVNGDERRAVSLASALVKVAMLGIDSRAAAIAAPVWSTFHDPSVLEHRVRRLVSGARRTAHRLNWARAGVAVVMSLLVGAWAAGVPGTIHHLTEALVRMLP